MRKSLILIIVVGLSICASGLLQAQIPNAGFETWTAGQAAGWSFITYPGTPGVVAGTPAHSGSFALKATVMALAGTTFPIPILISSTPAFRWTTRSATLTGYYQFFPAAGSNDSLFIGVIFYGAGGTYIGAGGMALGASATYRQFVAPIFYATEAPPDSAWIQMVIAGANPLDQSVAASLGSSFLLDDLAFAGIAQVTGVSDPISAAPQSFELQQNYPNPFNPSTRISFSVAQAGTVQMKVFNVLGSEVATLMNENKSAGRYSVNWNAAGLPSGVYLCRMIVSSPQGMLFTDTKRITLMK